MKVRDKIVCINNSRSPFLKNEIYIINEILQEVYIIKGYHFSIITRKGHYNFTEYFITLKAYRKNKLAKINQL